MTNAPTIRETADHAELAAMKPDDILAILRADRLPECSFDNGMTWVTDDVIVAETFVRAADVLDYLLSEIAALRRLRDDLRDTTNAYQARYRQAERQRDEAVGLMRDVVGPGWTRQAWSDARAFLTRLANQGADQ